MSHWMAHVILFPTGCKLCLVPRSVIESFGDVCGPEHVREHMAAWQLPCSQPQGHQHSRHHTERWAETGTILTTLDTYIILCGQVMPYTTENGIVMMPTFSMVALQVASLETCGVFGSEIVGIVSTLFSLYLDDFKVRNLLNFLPSFVNDYICGVEISLIHWGRGKMNAIL